MTATTARSSRGASGISDRVVVLYLHGPMRCCRTFRRIQSVVRMAFLSPPS